MNRRDRRSYAARPAASEVATSDIERPQSAIERFLADLWRQVIGVDEVGLDDSFFDLGGHSLHAHRNMARLEQILELDLPPRLLYEAPELRTLARRVEEALIAKWRAEGVLAGEAGDEEVSRLLAERRVDALPRHQGSRQALPLSEAQERLWFLEQLHPGNRIYNVSRALHLRGALDIDALRAAFDALVERHETLRSAFYSLDGEAVHRVDDRVEVALPLLDLRGLDPAERLLRADQAKAAEARTPFDLGRAPLVRLRLLLLGEQEHQLLITVHHLIFDGWSLGVLFHELSQLYRSSLTGEPPALVELPIQFGDYALWERRQRRDDKRDLAFWKAALDGHEPLQLPADHPRPAVSSLRGRLMRLHLGQPLTAALESLAEAHGVSLFMVLAAGWATLLGRFAGQNDLLVGTPVAGRARAESEGLIAFFVNTLALRFDLSGDPTVVEVLARARELILDAFAHQNLPYARLVEELAPERSLSHAPLVQVTFAFQNAPLDPLDLEGLTLSDLEVLDPGQTDQDFSLSLALIGGELRGELTYNSELFDRTSVRRLIRSFELLLQGFVRSPQNRLSQLDRLDAAQRQQLLYEWNDTAVEAVETTLADLFAAQAARTPGAEALSVHPADGAATSLTYAELDARVSRLAVRLRALGVGPDQLVALVAERSAEMVIGMLAVHRAGGAYVPIDPAYPAERSAYMLADALRTADGTASGVLLVQEGLRATLEIGDGIRELVLDSELRDEVMATPAGARPRPLNLAHVIYTSGSTGRPKGVAINHQSAVLLVEWARRHYADDDSGADDFSAVVASTSINFDLSIFEIFAPLCAGGRVLLIDHALRLADAPAPRLLNTVPSAMSELARSGELPGSLRTVNLAGEPLRRELVEAIYAGGRVERVFNLYGPSEDTTYSTWTLVPRGSGAVSIGRPLPGTRAQVVDRHLQPVPIGVPGHLLLGGDQLARGYWRRPALTAAAFIPDPAARRPGMRLYRTGDLVRWLAGGELDFLGRIDHQVKIRGFRIELGEVESRLLEHGDLREVVVLAREDRPGDRRLVAYAAPRPGREPDADALRAHLAARLPDYMVPSHFVVLDALPHTPNGKVDRKALPRPGAEESGAELVAPEGRAEELLATLWGRLFERSPISAEDRFFDLGGHSLDAHRHLARLRQLTGVELPVRRLYEMPRLADLARALEEELRAVLVTALPEASESELASELDRRLRRALAGAGREKIERRAPGSSEAPLSFAQQRLWFLEQLDRTGALYNLPLALRLDGALDATALAAAVAALAERHEVLRTAFVDRGGEPQQQIAARVDLVPAFEDLTALPAAGREAELERRLAAEAARPFDLARAPLCRVRCWRLAEGEHVLVWNFHHLIFDGWSIGVLLRDLAALYISALAAARPGVRESEALPPLRVQYGDFAVWEREHGTGTWQADIEFWRQQLAGELAPLELPFDRPRPLLRSYGAGLHRFAFSPRLTTALRTLAEERQTSLFMALLAAWGLLLARHAGQSDVIIGTPVAGRVHEETEPLIGFFVNTLPLRLDLAGRPSVGALLDRVRDTVLDALAHQQLPFARLVEAVAPQRSLSYAPIVQVTLAYQNAGDEREAAHDRLGEARIRDFEVLESGKSDQELTLSVEEKDGGLRGVLIYNTDVFDAATTARLLSSFEVLLDSLTRDAARPVTALELLSARQRRQLLEWNDTGRPRPEKTLPELLAAQTERTPDALAVVHGGRALSFRELARRSATLAARLQRRGIGGDRRVGVAAERSIDLVVALVGVLRAGGAYVPLDPAYPRERLDYLIADAAPGVVLRQRGLEGVFGAGEGSGEGCEMLELETVLGADGAGESAPDEARISPENLAYLIYTSGSTGQPKGVAITHRSAVELLYWASEAFTADERRGMFAATSINFDLSVFEIFLPLTFGGTVILGKNALDLAALGGRRVGVDAPVIDTVPVTLVNTVPSAMAELLELGGLPPSVRTVNLAGEPLREPLVARLYRQPGVERVVDLYGPSEDTTYSTYAPRRAGGVETIGVPIANTRAHIVDRWLRLAPPGVAGELCLSGRGLARGYLGRPALTAEKFVPDPFSPEVPGTFPEVPGTSPGGGRMYRTGDLVRHLAGGRMQFLGRIDHQVKVRGFRIELGEIEVRLLEHPQLREAVVMVEKANTPDARLVAFAVPTEPDLDAAELRRHLGESLPEYMVPSAFALLDELPRLPNGKIDRKALAAHEFAPARAATSAYQAPRNALEERLAVLWSEILGVERVGVDDNFFTAGGHSLLATQVVARLQAEGVATLPLRAVFEAPTIAALAELIGDRGVEVEAAIEPLAADAEPVLSTSQERLWFLDRLEPETAAAYLIVDAVRLDGELEVSVLERALEATAARHESLRLRFSDRGGQARLRIAEPQPFRLPVIDLGATDAGEQDRLVDEQLRTAAARPLDLETGPLWTARLLRLGERSHVLIWVHHHIVSDGWSMGLFLRDTALAYDASLAGEPPHWPELPVRYVDHAAAQRRRLESGAFDAQIDHWRQRLDGLEEGLELPTDAARRSQRRHRAGQFLQRLDPALSERLRQLTAEEGATLFMLLAAVLGALIGRLSGKKTVALGTPIAGRGRREVEDLVGLFLNTLVLRLDLDGDGESGPSFRRLLARAREAALGAFAHQDVPFERLLEVLRPERDLSRTPYFQVMLNMLHLPHEAVEFHGLELSRLDVPIPHAKFDWTLYVVERDGALAIDWVYDADLYSAERMAETARQLESLLRQAVEDPAAPIDRWQLVTDPARRQLVDPGADLRVPWHGACHDHFVARALTVPDRPAVDDGTDRWSYRDIEEHSRWLAAELQRRGIGRGEPVAIYAHRSAAMVWTLLGVLRSGAAFVILDPAYPPARLRRIVELAGPRLLLRLAAAGTLPAEIVAVVEEVLEIGARPRFDAVPDLEPIALVPEDLAYIAFTSGSSGQPKGILGLHGGLGTFVPALVTAFGFSEKDRFSMLSALAHDPLHRDILTPLQLGAALSIPDEERLGEPGYLAGWMRRERISVAHLTPSLARILTAAAGGSAAVEEPLEALRHALMVGEPLRRADARRLVRLAPQVVCVNSYGATETGRAVSYEVVDPAVLGDQSAGGRDVLPLGQGLSDVQLLVMNRAGRLAGIGELGEVFIRSPHLTGGYLADPAATAARFIPHAGPQPGERVYRTGDLGRYRPDGRVDFAGRADQQVKIRGFRVELGEIESALSDHPALAEAAVAVRDGARGGGSALVAYLVPREGERPSMRELRSFLTGRLPDYMVPTQMVVLGALPLTPNRKLDRRALPEPERVDAFVAPRSEVEEVLAAIWSELLEVPEIGIRDNFFDLGGHSLHVSRHMYRLQELLDVHLPVRVLFEAQSIEEMALVVEEQLLDAVEQLDEGEARQQLEKLGALQPAEDDGVGAACALVLGSSGPTTLPEAEDLEARRARLSPARRELLDLRLRRVRDHSAYGRAIRTRQDLVRAPLSWFQEAFWFIEQREGAASVYRMWLENVLHGRLDAALFKAAVDDLVARQALLRTRFGVDDGGSSYQEILPSIEVTVPLVDLRELGEDDRESARFQVIDAMQAHPFDLARPPLFRLFLVRTEGDIFHLLLTLHHIISDVWSVGILIRDLAELYNARLAGRAPSLPELSIRFADYAVWERERIDGEALEKLLAYWGEKMAGGIPQLQLKTDRPRPAVSSFRGTIAKVELSEELTHALHQRSRDEELSLFMALMSAYKILLQRYSEQDDILVATPVANRARMQAEELIGCFASMVLLRTDLSGDPTVREVLARVRETTLGAFAHQDMPFFLLLANFAPPGYDFSSSPFQASFTLHNAPTPDAAFAGAEVAPGELVDRGTADIDLALAVHEEDGEIHLILRYDTDLFDAATVERMLAELRAFCEAIAWHPETPLSQLFGRLDEAE